MYPQVTQFETMRMEVERKLQLLRELRPRVERAPRARRRSTIVIAVRRARLLFH